MKMQLIRRALIDFADEPQVLATKTKDGAKLQARFVSNNPKTLWRYQTLYTKEPATIAWLEELDDNDVLWDVGSNVGVYSIFAALVRRARVFAFEPGAANYWILNSNIKVNALEDRIQAMCAALSDQTKLDTLHMRSTGAGQTLNQTKRPVDDHGKSFTPSFRQSVFLVTADDLIARFGVVPPTAMKIDVDGAELDVLAGASGLLLSPDLRRISLELNRLDTATVERATATLTGAGFTLTGSYKSPLAGEDVIRNYHFVRM